MFKNIIPKLVSIDTDLKIIKGLHISQDMDFFDCTSEKNLFHYKVALKNDIEIPKDYEFRSEYFIKKGKSWYYERKMFFWNFKFEYNLGEKTFYFNKTYSFLPFRIGGLFPVGEHITGIIILDLFLAGYTYIRGMALQIENKNICFIAPGFNGKTRFLIEQLKKGAKYIAEDILIISFFKKETYLTCPFLKYNFWQKRKIDMTFGKILKKNTFLENPLIIDKIFLLQNSLSLDYQSKNKDCFDFLLLNSLFFFDNLFIRSYIFEEGLSKKVFEQISNLKNLNIEHSFLVIKNFNINSILQKL